LATLAAERSLSRFVREAWHVVEPDVPLIGNWHIQAICQHLEAQTAGQIKRLLINVPPGTLKSILVCVMWPAWEWITFPGRRFLFGSYDQALSTRDSLRCRALLESRWYQTRWGDRFKPRGDQNQKTRFDNNRGGWRIATSVGGRGTGEHPDRKVFDDPHSARQAASNALRQGALDWWDQTMGTRGEPRGATSTGIMQRLHTRDLSGHVLQRGGWDHLMLPMEFDPDHPHLSRTALGFVDPRTEPGELLCPELFSRGVVEDLKRNLGGSTAIAGQLQQRPTAAGGAIFRGETFRYFRQETVLQEDGEQRTAFILQEPDGESQRVWADQCWWFQTADTAMEVGEDNAYTVVQTAILTPPPVRLLVYDIFRKRLEIPFQFNALMEQRNRHPLVQIQAVEKAASGRGLLQEARLRGLPMRALVADRSKERRAVAIATAYENGLVYHRALNEAPWLPAFEQELEEFPNSEFADQVDTSSYAGLIMQERAYRGVSATNQVVGWPRPSDKDEQAVVERGNGNGQRVSLAEAITGRRPSRGGAREPEWFER
jgi:predicted phage terminase large subunit-like protein